MRRWVRRVGGLLLLAGLLALLAWLRSEPEQLIDADGARVRVIDGDSLRIGERIVRIGGIDAVELRQLCTGDDNEEWSCGLEARAALEAMVAAGGLVCATSEQDRYGRAVARCRTAAVRDVAAELVAQGWAVSGDGAYLVQQVGAKARGRGVWRGAFQRPAEWRAGHPREGD